MATPTRPPYPPAKNPVGAPAAARFRTALPFGQQLRRWRERNARLVAAGYAPMYRERPLSDPALAAARAAVELILKSHKPWPALAVDRHWNLVTANRQPPTA